jgi:hypothetical protein
MYVDPMGGVLMFNHTNPLNTSMALRSVFHRMAPVGTVPLGRWAVVPAGTPKASVVPICNDKVAVVVPIPMLLVFGL